MTEIGIMTMHRVRNYGSFLQAYALKRMLEQLGCRVRFLDIETAPVPPVGGKLRYLNRHLLKRLRFQKSRRKLRAVFEGAQREYLGLGAPVFSASGCDAVVIGSDEIFNCDSAGAFPITARRFGAVPGVGNVISYAASCGQTGPDDIAQRDWEPIAQGLANLNAVSVRDEHTARFVSRFRAGEPLRHLDPVLVYDFAAELAAVREEALPKQPYLLVYAYHNRIRSRAEIRAIRAYAKRCGLRTVAVGGLQAWCDEYPALNPFEALRCFQRAACVVTDTFHGVVMSTKFRKPFAVLVRDSNANKLEDLLARLSLQARRVRNMDDLAAILDRPLEKAALGELLEAEKKRSEDYLRTALRL